MILSAIIIALIGLALACWFYWGMGYPIVWYSGHCLYRCLYLDAY